MSRQLKKRISYVQAPLCPDGKGEKTGGEYEQKYFEQDFITGIGHFDGILYDPTLDRTR